VLRLGGRTFGTVFLADDLRMHREVALRVLPPGDRATMLRFRRESETLAYVDSPYLARVLDVAVLGPRPYLVAERVWGRSLGCELDGDPRPAPAALEVVFPVLRALEEAHARGIVHRDVRPSNVILARGRDAPEVPKLVDFGLAGRFGAAPTAPDALAYAAPEMLRGGRPDPRADVYATGTLLFRLLTGRTPIDPRAHGTPRSLLRAILGARRPTLGGALGAVVSAAIDPRPERRHGDAAVMRSALERACREDRLWGGAYN